ncbi:MAG: hypothetical protein ACE5HO_07785 [bacterium]
MKEVEFVVVLDDGVRKRHVHNSDKGEILSFVVQLEFFYKGKWRPVIRYDSAHGFAHIDSYNYLKPTKKIPLNLDFNSALNLAEWDIGNNWEKYIKAYRRQAK